MLEVVRSFLQMRICNIALLYIPSLKPFLMYFTKRKMKVNLILLITKWANDIVPYGKLISNLGL